MKIGDTMWHMNEGEIDVMLVKDISYYTKSPGNYGDLYNSIKDTRCASTKNELIDKEVARLLALKD